jgi:pSer/pThr/pTyr-binding forkhead associated (FHA) protein
MPTLVFIDQWFSGRICELASESISVGRDSRNRLAIHHPSVSRVHCEILVHGPEVIVRELGSTNGTFVNGIRVRQQAQIKSGQILRLGQVEARLDLGSSREDETASEISAVYSFRRLSRKGHPVEQAQPGAAATHLTFEHQAVGISSLNQETVRLPILATVACQTTPSGLAQDAGTGLGARWKDVYRRWQRYWLRLP